HVDFAYEVSRSLSACEGAVLVVDASQGVEAQTLANVYLALEHDLAVVPVINKIDLPSADVEGTRKEIEEVIGLDASKAVPTSAKEGVGIEELLEEIIHTVPPPAGDPEAPLKALIFDSWYDSYRGVIMLVRIVEGTVRPRQKIIFMSNRREYEVSEVGVFAPKAREKGDLIAGEVGFVVANVKVIQDAKVGDTLTDAQRPTTSALAGFKVVKKDGSELSVDNPAKLPGEGEIEKLMEPMLLAHIYVPNEYVGPVLQLCQDRRGTQKDIKYIGTKRVQITYEIPLAEVVFDFFDKLKSISRGYASLDYEPRGYQEADLVKLDILINGEPVDALSTIVHRERAYQRGRAVCEKLKEEIPKQMYEVAIQAAIGARVIARETQKAFRKNVLAKCYGGDISRKRKLLEKQKEGKKRMKSVGSVEIPQEAFLAVLKVEE